MMPATPISLPAPSDDFMDWLAGLPLFQNLSEKTLSTVGESADRRCYSAGQTVYALGQYDGSEFFIVVEGCMKVSVTDCETGAMLIEEVGPGGVFAMELTLSSSAIDDFQHVTVTAEGDLTILAIDADAFRALAAHRPSLMRNIAMYFAGELAARRFKNMTAEAAPEQRILSLLLKLVERDPITGQWRVPRMPKHRELADEAGVEESVSAGAIANLIQDGVARRDYPGLIIDDMSRLNQLVR